MLADMERNTRSFSFWILNYFLLSPGLPASFLTAAMINHVKTFKYSSIYLIKLHYLLRRKLIPTFSVSFLDE